MLYRDIDHWAATLEDKCAESITGARCSASCIFITARKPWPCRHPGLIKAMKPSTTVLQALTAPRPCP